MRQAPNKTPRKTPTRALQAIALQTLLCCAAAAAEWTEAAPMIVPRQYPGLVRLPDGRILAVTGHPLENLLVSVDSAEIYDPEKNTWTPTGSLHLPRNGVEPGGLNLLPNGKVLISGSGSGSRSVHEAELYDPQTGAWSVTGSMSLPRCVHTTTQLEDGRVLVTGGIDWITEQVHATTEIYDFESGTWASAGTMQTPRFNHRAVRLPDGRVLVLGGAHAYPDQNKIVASAEIYDPKTGAWRETTPMTSPRRAFGIALLQNGSVLVAGGASEGSGDGREIDRVEIFDPATEKWTPAAPLKEARWGPTATLLRDGSVLVTGGMYATSGRRASAERFDPATGAWSDAGKLRTRRNGHRDITLDDGRVLIVGGYSGVAYLKSVEVYTP